VEHPLPLSAWKEKLQGKGFQTAATWARAGLFVAILVYLAIRLSDIGWAAVWQSLPQNIWFYVLFGVIYLILPICDQINYQIILRLNLWQSFPIFLRKRVFNFAVFGYSGEAYFIFWARKHLGLTDRKAFTAVKDSNILSGLVSNSVTVILLIVFLITGQLKSVLDAVPNMTTYIAGGALATIILLPVVIRFRQHLVSLPVKTALLVILVHVIRIVLIQGLTALQWSVALPLVPFSVWLLFLTAQMVLTRIPFLPNQDLALLTLGLSMTGFVNAPSAAVAAMFVAAGALTQLAHLVVYVLTSFGSHAPRKLHPIQDFI
jgi:hypothetical protein